MRVVEITGVGFEYLSGIWSWTGHKKRMDFYGILLISGSLKW